MAERNDISGFLAFIGREGDWRERLQDVIAEHLMPALEEFEIDQDDLALELGEGEKHVEGEAASGSRSSRPMSIWRSAAGRR